MPLAPPLDAMEQALDGLESVPALFVHQALINSRAPARERLQPMMAARAALIAGAPLPAVDGTSPEPTSIRWPDAGLLAGFAEVVHRRELASLCTGREDLVDALLRSFLWHSDHIIDYRDKPGDACDEHEARHRALQAFDREWRLTTQEVQGLLDVFFDLGDLMKNNRWSEVRGLLSSEPWAELVKIRRLLEQLPELAGVIRQLGRAELTDEPDPDRPPLVPAFEQRALREWVVKQQRSPDMPGETRGVERSGRIARMLPGESVALHHPSCASCCSPAWPSAPC